MSLHRHAALNLAGVIIPMALAIPTLGLLARTLSAEQFSLVTLAWALVGFAGVFDLGLSRSIVRTVARDRACTKALAATLTTAVLFTVLLGALASLLLFLNRRALTADVLQVTKQVLADANAGFAIVALTIPFLLPGLIIQGYWDGVENFVESNIQRIASGSLVSVFTAIAVLLSPTFTSAMSGLLAARIVSLAVALQRRRTWRLVLYGRPTRERLVELLQFGGWITVSNIVGPIMGYLDRYVLGFTNTAAVVAFYAAPSEAAVKLLALPNAITRGLFPKLVDPSTTQRATLVRQAYIMVVAACVPLAAVTITFAAPILSVWLGAEYALRSATALQVLMVGFVFCSFAQIPYTEIQAAGRADLTAKVHLIEVLPFLAMAVILTTRFGVTGAAVAWSLRNAADFLFLSYLARALKR